MKTQFEHPRESLSWSVDEYLIVGELYSRRGRSSGTHDVEVIELANLLGRSPASISYRLGNFAGTELPGTGLKPLAGEPLEAWNRVKDSPSRLNEAARIARTRMQLLLTKPESTVVQQPRLVPPEDPSTDAFEFISAAVLRESKQLEARLRRDFVEWFDPKRKRLKGITIPVPDGRPLRVDLYNIETNVLIEVKAVPSRNMLRQAVGQLLDYQRYLEFRPVLAVLLPEFPRG